MKRACSRCRKEHRACEGGLPCRRCVALGSPELCHKNDDDIEHRKKQEGRCSRQVKSHSIATPTKQEPELGRQEQTCPQFKKPHQRSTSSSSSASPPPQGSATQLKGKPLTHRQQKPGHLFPLSSSIPLSADRPRKRKRSSKKEKHASTKKSAIALLEATPTASAKTDTPGSTSPGCVESAPAHFDGVLASLVEQVHQLSNMISCIQEEQNLMRMQVHSLQDRQFRIQLEAASISELLHRLAYQFATAYPSLESQRLPPLSFLNLNQTKGSMQYEGQHVQPALAPPSTTAPFSPPDLWFLEPPNDNLPTPVFEPISPMPSHLWPVEECLWGMTPRDNSTSPGDLRRKNEWLE
jgi:hypothetical protein